MRIRFWFAVAAVVVALMVGFGCDYVPSHYSNGMWSEGTPWGDSAYAADSAWADSMARADSIEHAKVKHDDLISDLILWHMLGLF